MLLDETLNMDIHSSARYHVAITSHLAKNDPKKFTFSTPKEVSLLIPQVRMAHKYPIPPWEMIHPPGGG
jgi:hypothetical protein